MCYPRKIKTIIIIFFLFVLYVDLVYNLKRIVGMPNFSDQFKQIIKSYNKVVYNMDIMRQSACLVV